MSKRLPPLPKVSDIIRLYGLSAKQQLSQNFLLDLNVTDKIVRLAQITQSKCVCEVGPGPGSLTRSILNATSGTVLVVEKDRRFLPSLELLSDATDGRLKVFHDDILKFNWEESCDSHVTSSTKWEENISGLNIIGNLPFNVSIPLLLQWLESISVHAGPFKYGRCPMILTFQKEVAERIVAPPTHTQRGRLSVMVQHLCDVKWLYTLDSSVFTPQPKVDAVVLKLVPLINPLINVNYHLLEKVVKLLFQYRRKYIRKGARLLFPEAPELAAELFDLSGVDDTMRAQEMTLHHFEAICNAYSAIINNNCNITANN